MDIFDFRFWWMMVQNMRGEEKFLNFIQKYLKVMQIITENLNLKIQHVTHSRTVILHKNGEGYGLMNSEYCDDGLK